MSPALELLITVRSEMRKSNEATLKKYGLNWTKLDKLEAEAISEIPAEGIEKDGLVFVVEEKPVYLSKLAGKQFDTVKRIRVHSK